MSANTEPDNPDVQSADITPDIEVDDSPEVEPEPEVESESESQPEPERDSEPETETETEGDVDTEAVGADVEDADEEPEDDAKEAVDEESVTGPPRQFQAAIKGGEIKEFVETLRALVDEAKFHISPDGIQARAVDPANVAMDDIELFAAAFESYDATEGILGLNLERLEDVLKLANKGDLVQLSFDTSTFKLVIHIDGVEFTMACIDPDSIRQEPDIPDMDLPISFTAEEAKISRGVKAADMVSDHIMIRCDETEQAVHIEASGDTDDVDLELTNDDDLVALTAADGEALYSLDYVKDISRKIPKNAEVTMTFGTDFPVMIEYEFADGEGKVLSMIAPRIRSD
jgi:proliferating cell nuclear antigen